MKVLGIGDNVVDVYTHTNTMYPGGNALNFAVYAAGFGVEAAYLGMFGDDRPAHHVYHTIREIGLDVSHCRFRHGENGYAKVRLEDGDRRFVGSNKGGVNKIYPFELTGLDYAYIGQFDIVHTSIFSYLEPELEQLGKHSRFLSMDFSDSASEDYLKQCAPHLDCACLSCGDMPADEIQEKMNRILGYGCRRIVIATRGAKGAMVMADGRLYEQSPCLVKAKDTMGAGDSFITSFLVHYLEELSGAVDFPAGSGSRGTVTREAFQVLAAQTSLYQAAVYSAENCGKDGAFGYGVDYEL